MYSLLEYYDPLLHQPYGVWHILHFGPGKDYISFVLTRMNAGKGLDPKDKKTPLKSPFLHPGDLKKVTRLRLAHFVMRGVTKCRFVDFTEHLGQMTLSEVQLVYEVGLPYLMHDWVKLGVPEAVVLMGCEVPPSPPPPTRSTLARPSAGF
jgi:hypothetical protein